MIADRLRAAILQAAISGELTDQRPEDGTATELLEQIAAERAALIKAGKLKKQKPLPPVSADEQAFVLPASWVWARVAHIGSVVGGGTPKTTVSSYWGGDIPWITPADLGKLPGRYVSGGSRSITAKGLSESSARLLPARSVVMSSRAPIGHLAIAEEDLATNQGCKSIVLQMPSQAEYVYFALLASVPMISKLGTGTTFKEISGLTFGTVPIPLPPLAEQERIVAKLDEVLPLIDQLAELEREREYLDREFAKAIERAILQAAISGKLTKQHPEDGTAEELLETIKTERQQLEKEGKIKKQKPLPPVDKEDEPFELPDTWKWVQIGSAVDLINGRAYKQQELQTSGKWPVLRVGNLFTNESWYYSDLDLEEDKYCDNGDLLYAWSASFGPHIWQGGKSIFHYHIWKVRHYSMNRDYLNYVLQWDVDRIRTATTGSTMVHVSMTNMRPRTIPVAPISEQDRIVGKLDSMLPLTHQVGELVS